MDIQEKENEKKVPQVLNSANGYWSCFTKQRQNRRGVKAIKIIKENEKMVKKILDCNVFN